MKPKGLVAAASITSQTSIPSLAHIIASSFAIAMLTARKVFSSSFVISAVAGDETGITRSIIVEYRAFASRRQAGVTPPITLGMLLVWKRGLPGSTRSGEKAR